MICKGCIIYNISTVEKEEVDKWVKLSDTEKDFADSFERETENIVCGVIPQTIRNILQPFKDIQQRVIFRREFDRKIKQRSVPIADLVQPFNDSLGQHGEVCGKLKSG